MKNALLFSSCMLFPIYNDPVGLYDDPVWLCKDAVGLYNKLQGFMMMLWGCTPDTGQVARG
jgi:hypothetical protein